MTEKTIIATRARIEIMCSSVIAYVLSAVLLMIREVENLIDFCKKTHPQFAARFGTNGSGPPVSLAADETTPGLMSVSCGSSNHCASVGRPSFSFSLCNPMRVQPFRKSVRATHTPAKPVTLSFALSPMFILVVIEFD